MRLVRNRVDARHLPSRHNFALFRLIAYARSLRTTPQTGDVIVVLDRNQSNTETQLVCWWYVLTLSCFVSTFFRGWAVPLALLVSLPIVVVGVEVPVVLFGLLASIGNTATHTRTTSIMHMAFFGGVSTYFAATQTTWVRFAGLQVLVLFALNAVAAGVVFLLRGPIARLEASFGGAESAL